MKRIFACVFLSLAVVTPQAIAQYGDVEPVPEALQTGYRLITAEQADEWLNLLAGPTFNGRGTGQVGYAQAAHWVAGKLAEFGIEPKGNGDSYFQLLPMKRRVADVAESSIEGPDGLKISGQDLGFQRFADQPSATGPVVLLRVTGEEVQLDPEISLRDKIVILATRDTNDFRVQIRVARQQPAAVIRLADAAPSNQTEVQRGGRRRSQGMWCSISPSAAEQLQQALGIESGQWTPPEEAGVHIQELEQQLTVNARIREEQLTVPNVIGWLEGSDPELKHEFVVLGAHLDHLGTRGDQVYPGADDNGSGSTAILSVARAMAENPVRPKRSVLFIWFAAEEIGLVGSRYFTENPTVPLDNCICMLNCDMVGRHEETDEETAEENIDTIHLIGSQKGDTALHQLILDANRHVGFQFEYDQESVFGRSDQANFWRKGIPVAFVFGGFHPDYHQPTDKPAKISYEKIASAARLFYLAIFNLAEHGPLNLQLDQSSSD